MNNRDESDSSSVIESILHSELTLRIFEESNDAFIIFRPSDGGILEVNATAQRLSRSRRSELIDCYLVDVIKSSVTLSVEALLESTRQTGLFQAKEGFSLTRSDGSVVPLSVSVSRIHIEPEPVGLLVARDISERVAMQQQLREKEREIDQAASLSALGELVAALVHEIRQPLCAISNFAEAANAHVNGGNDRLASGMLERIIGEAFRSNRIVNQIQAFVKRDTPDISTVDANGAIAETLSILQSDISRSGAAISLELDELLPPVAICEIHLQQVMSNLIRNAIDSMENAGTVDRQIVISTAARDEAAEIFVRDTGPGIPKTFAPRLFQPFQTTRADGMGMGLAVSRRLMLANKGSLDLVTSTIEGTEFRITIPFSREDQV